MSHDPPFPPQQNPIQGDRHPARASDPCPEPENGRIGPTDVTYLMQLADTLNTTLDLQTLLARTSQLVCAIIPYRIFAIFLLNDRTHDLRMRFQIGHSSQSERARVPVGKGVVGQVALTRQPILLNDVSASEHYITANPEVRSELSLPLIAKNRLIGVMDIESEQIGYFSPEHLRLLTLTAPALPRPLRTPASTRASPARRKPLKCSTKLRSSSPLSSILARCSNASANCSAA
jgi:sigma-B regulation protein RsbU (phosphoserine phosphatase)